MKKLLFLPFFILGLFIAEPATAKNSTSTKADFNGHMQSPDDNEYMFLTESVFNTVKAGYDSGKKEIYADGVYECGDASIYKDGSVVCMPSGHVLAGTTINEQKCYGCSTHGMDAWIELSKKNEECEKQDLSARWLETDARNTTDVFYISKKTYIPSAGVNYCFRSEQMDKCLNAQHRKEPANWTGTSCNCGDTHNWNSATGKCEGKTTQLNCDGDAVGTKKSVDCSYNDETKNEKNAKTCQKVCEKVNGNSAKWFYYIDTCKNGYHTDNDKKRCIQNAPVVPEDDEEDDGKRDDSESSLEKCLRERAGMSAEALACCYLKSSVAKYNFSTQKCECKNGGTFEIAPDGRGGTCKAPGGDGDDGRSVTPPDDDESTAQPVVTETYKCDPTRLAFISKWQIDCKDKQNIITQIEVINAHCNGLNPEKETFDTYYKMLQALNPDECAIENARKAAEEQIRAKKVQEFKSKFSTLEKIESGFGDKSVWKNKDGKFNTARLASDSIAGVVLGTAGGLITSHVVKKNQEKSGFEDIKCTVGGQEIGDFGDQMNVGIN